MRELAAACLSVVLLVGGLPPPTKHTWKLPNPQALRWVARPRFEAPPRRQLPAAADLDGWTEHTLLDVEGQRVALLGLEPGEVAAFVSFVYLSCGKRVHSPPPRCHSPRPPARQQSRAGGASAAGDDQLRPRSRYTRRDGATEGCTSPPRATGVSSRLQTSAEIAAVLADFGQDAVALRGPDGDWTGSLRHVLKVFLVDDSPAASATSTAPGSWTSAFSRTTPDPAHGGRRSARRLGRRSASRRLGRTLSASGAPRPAGCRRIRKAA